MGNSKSSLMLKYQKAKVKLLEYEVPENEWPSFPLNYKDLAFPTVLTISQYAEAINEDLDIKIKNKSLRYCSDFYDAALQSREQIVHDADFALSAAAAYFFMDNLGSSKVMWQEVDSTQIIDEAQECLFEVFSLAFTGKTTRNSNYVIAQAIKRFWEDGNNDSLRQTIEDYRKQVFETASPQTWFWGEIACAVAKTMGNASARILLPQYSSLVSGTWEKYFSRKTAINLMWPSQRLVGESKMLQGASGILQLPTGVGKTKSIELIIWAMFLSKRGSKALIVAPLRSLCNEITFEMRMAFPEEVTINQFSDVLEDDFIDILLGNTVKQILVSTPEKLQYIFHHDTAFFSAIDLYIFDESHMFDDRNRGAMYELLLTDIKLNRKDDQQLVLMSAVLPNADQIVKWLFGEEGVLAYDSNIQSTPKTVGFADKNKQLHYYSSADEEEDYFVPYTYKTYKLKRLGRERKERFFPEDPNDRALYYTNILCKSGGVAIYFSQKRYIPKLFARIEDLEKRSFSLERIRNASDASELAKFRALYKEYYGEDHIYTKTVEYGILPHYSALPNGIKISTEYSYKKNLVKAVACTSTLAQGVNIPIKYLIITGTNNAFTQMSVRNFQNLIGRTGRSGVFTEGDIIVTDNKLYDERTQGRGFYRWKETRALFNSTAVEACGSSILNIVKDFSISYNVKIAGAEIVKIICNHISDSNWGQDLANELLNIIQEQVQSGAVSDYKKITMDQVINYKEDIGAIENEILYFLLKHPLSETHEQLHSIVNTLLENSLAYYLANQDEKELLHQVFDALETKIANQIDEIKNYFGIMVSMADANRIKEWIANNSINTVKLTARELVQPIEKLYREVYPSLNLQEGFALAWIRGDSYNRISDDFGIKVDDVEKKCQYNLSFQMSFLVGNIIDLVEVDCVNLDALMLLQQALRYGVNTKTAISICEKIFNDRFLAKEIARLLGSNGISSDDIVAFVKGRKKVILSLVSRYPAYFESVIQNI